MTIKLATPGDRKLHSVRASGRESILNERVAIGTMEVMGAAYLSELRGRKPVTPEEYRVLQSFVQNGKSDEEIILSIIHELMRPYSEE